jgi:predicted neutral ceramidase superfamily lipid hydrolase
MLPIGFNNRDELAVDHGKQAMYMAFFTVIILTGLTLLPLVIPKSFRPIKLALVILFYLVLTLYFVICGAGTYMIKNGKKGKFPYIRRFAEKLDI